MLEIMFASVQNILKDKHPEKWKSGDLFLNHDGEWAHSLSVHEFLAVNKTAIILHSCYALDIVLCDPALQDDMGI